MEKKIWEPQNQGLKLFKKVEKQIKTASQRKKRCNHMTSAALH